MASRCTRSRSAANQLRGQGDSCQRGACCGRPVPQPLGRPGRLLAREGGRGKLRCRSWHRLLDGHPAGQAVHGMHRLEARVGAVSAGGAAGALGTLRISAAGMVTASCVHRADREAAGCVRPRLGQHNPALRGGLRLVLQPRLLWSHWHEGLRAHGGGEQRSVRSVPGSLAVCRARKPSRRSAQESPSMSQQRHRDPQRPGL